MPFQALQTIDGEITQQLSLRRKHREGVGPYYDANIYTQGPMGVIPEALRPRPGHLSHSQQRVYEVEILEWDIVQNQVILLSIIALLPYLSLFPRILFGFPGKINLDRAQMQFLLVHLLHLVVLEVLVCLVLMLHHQDSLAQASTLLGLGLPDWVLLSPWI